MRYNLVTILLSAAALATAAHSGLEKRQDTGDGCEITKFEFDCPNDITLGQPFRVKFCPGEYFKTSSNKIWFTWGLQNASTGVHGRVPVVEMTPNISNGYLFNATIRYTQSRVDGNYSVGILEYINDYYVPHSFKWFPKEVYIHP